MLEGHTELIVQNRSGALSIVKAFASVCSSENGYHLLIWMRHVSRNIGLLDTEGRVLGLGTKLRRLVQTNSTFFQVVCPAFSSVINNIEYRKEGEVEEHEFHILISTAIHQ